ncbi:MAG TPA: hypothetical protein VH080_10100, partial [Gemmatimonadaceae bacterium]|nr:hypothetical protein [Gemmatimonadaceae bacterium]
MRVSRLVPALGVLSTPLYALPAQTWRTVESTRGLRDSVQHSVRVRYGAGRIDVGSTNAPVLYTMTLRYDE